MYDTGDFLPISTVPDGTTVLCHGPPMIGKRRLATGLLARGIETGDGVAIVSTDTSATKLRAEIESATGRSRQRRLGIVDCTGETSQVSDEPLDRVVSSPADLTGIGVAVSEILEALTTDEGVDACRVGLLSLTSTFLYAEPERVLKFVHVLTQRIEQMGGFGFLLAQEGSIDDESFAKLGTLVDASLAVDEDDGDTVCRVRGLPDAPSSWHTVALDGTETGTPTRRAGAGTTLGTPVDTSDRPAPDWVADLPDRPGLSEIVAAVERSRPTLSVYNFEGDRSRLDALRTHCETMNVSLREGRLQDSEPCNLAVLHRGPDVIDAGVVQSLFGALELDSAAPAEIDRPDLLGELGRDTFGARGASRQFLVDMSHVIETEAWHRGTGRIHAGFQDLSRLWDDEETRRLYRRLVDAGIEAHVYGTGDRSGEAWSGLTEHAVEDPEIADTWFVAYDGDGDPDAMATLLVEERDPDVYTGFWSFRPAATRVVVDHLERTYATAPDPDGSGGRDPTRS